MRFSTLVLTIFNAFFLLAQPTDAEQIPSVRNISNENYELRQQATLRLKKWAFREKKYAIEQLLKIYFTSEDPEFRSRVHWIIQDIRINNATSYLGLSYMAENAVIDGSKRTVLIVKKLKSDGPAELGGLAVGDKIISVDGQSFDGNTTKADIRAILGNLPGGEKVIFTIIRSEKKLSVHVRPQAKERKPEDMEAAQKQFQNWMLQRENEFRAKP